MRYTIINLGLLLMASLKQPLLQSTNTTLVQLLSTVTRYNSTLRQYLYGEKEIKIRDYNGKWNFVSSGIQSFFSSYEI